MKKLFLSHIPDSAQEIERVWQEAIIVFDANTILNLYRYSDKSRTEFVALLNTLKQRIWTPEQAAHEYFKNRASVIGEQSSSYNAANKSISDLRDALRKDRGHPFIADETMTELTAILEKVEAELEVNKEMQVSRLSSDDIRTEIVEIFDGQVGKPFTSEELEKIFEDGKTRYEQKIPPGYKDATKHENPITVAEKRSVFGDLIVWKQTIAKAKEASKPIIFVTDDAKEDWWFEAHGRTLGPRIELLDEFHEEADQKFYMYRPDQFLKFAKEKLHSTVSPETIDEIRAADANRLSSKPPKNALSMYEKWGKLLPIEHNRLSHLADRLGHREQGTEFSELNQNFLNFRDQSEKRNWSELDVCRHRLKSLSSTRSQMRIDISELDEFMQSQEFSMQDLEELENLQQQRDELEQAFTEVTRELYNVKAEISALEAVVKLRNQ